MRRVVIIGATSAIAEKVARLYAERGDCLFLTGRHSDDLDVLSADLSVRGAGKVSATLFDINVLDSHEEVLQRAWEDLGEIDIVLLAVGTLPDQAICEKSVDDVVLALNSNCVSTIVLLTRLAGRMRAKGRGCIAVISSVAGDRGRAKNYIYGAAKAALTTYLSGLRQQLSAHNVFVITIKPGLVDTPMTANLKKGLLWSQPDSVAVDIVKAIDRKKAVVYTPWYWGVIMCIIRSIPESIFKRLYF